MNARKFLQIFVLISMLVVSLTFTSPVFAAHAPAGLCASSITVASGDTLRKIAERCGTTVAALRLANPELGSGNLIYPGQVLVLPGTVLYGNDGYDTYIVARGDTLKAVALHFGTSVNTLLSLNVSITNANVIYEGQRLVVPSGRAVPVPPPTGGQVYYAVKGDTLRKIAAKFGTTVAGLLRLNPQISNPNVIYVGQAITVPTAASTYAVQKGDTLRIIANKFGTTVDTLLVLNPKITNPNFIYVGQVIRVG